MYWGSPDEFVFYTELRKGHMRFKTPALTMVRWCKYEDEGGDCDGDNTHPVRWINEEQAAEGCRQAKARAPHTTRKSRRCIRAQRTTLKPSHCGGCHRPRRTVSTSSVRLGTAR